jgi:hypothetical protein
VSDVKGNLGSVKTGPPRAREMKGSADEQAVGDTPETCANCGATRRGPYCSACGQSGHIHTDLRALLHDLAHDVFHFEGKAWRTLVLLAWQPGELTRRYIGGERTKFVSPIGLFLFSVLLMFAVVSNLARYGSGAVAIVADTRNPVDSLASAQLQRLDMLKQQRAIAKDDRTRDALDQQILGQQNAIDTLQGLKKTAPNVGADWLDRMLQSAFAQPELLLYKVKSNGYKYSWALIPISLPFVWLLFVLRRDVGLYHHAIFAIYSLTFMSLVVVALTLLSVIRVPNALIFLAALLVAPVHMYRQLKGAYRLDRFGAGWRTFALLCLTLVSSATFLLFLLYIGSS